MLQAAVHAPSAINTQPWAFAVVQDPGLLKQWSDRARQQFLSTMETHMPANLRAMVTDPDFNMFYNAGTLILICAKSSDRAAAEDCYLAAENLMLAACSSARHLPIGFWRALGQSAGSQGGARYSRGYTPITPIIVGHPAASVAAIGPKKSRRYCSG